MVFGSINDKELCMAAKLAHDCYKDNPAPSCKEETKFTPLTMADTATTYFSFPGSHNAQDWKTNALNDMRPLSAWADHLPDFADRPQLAHQVEPLAQEAVLKQRRQEPKDYHVFKC